ncbi:hypothetical protein B0H65DRAFT_546460 [Neurospora tetraspora]|uniref:Uncharacterized protein n=1 Tax=Neurospora tetraspora TaxID=94610 RepID=A0AAE0JLV5_9PEZI|nr:hypothetical protein B0H65DRAFT_546460 [Neurospora tetraspora]
MFAPKLLAVVSLLSGAVFAAPAPAPAAELTDADGASVLLKRGEGIHLMNCEPTNGATNYISAVVYCANDGNCNNLSYSHSSSNVCVKSTSGSSGAYHVWEGSTQSCTFSSGVTFSWAIGKEAQTWPDYTYVGTGVNGYSTFSGYKDDKHYGVTYNSHKCRSIYYYI